MGRLRAALDNHYASRRVALYSIWLYTYINMMTFLLRFVTLTYSPEFRRYRSAPLGELRVWNNSGVHHRVRAGVVGPATADVCGES